MMTCSLLSQIYLFSTTPTIATTTSSPHDHATTKQSQIISNMFTRLECKVTALIRRTKSPTDVYANPQPHYLDSESDQSLSPTTSQQFLLSIKPVKYARPALAPKRGSGLNLSKSEDVSYLSLNDDDRLPRHSDLQPMNQSPMASWSRSRLAECERNLVAAAREPFDPPQAEDSSPEHSSVMKLVTIGYKHEKYRALLLTPFTLSRVQALGQIRRDLRELEPRLSATVARIADLLSMKSKLEAQGKFEISGAFPDEEADEERERWRALMLATRNNLTIGRKTLEDLEAQRTLLLAGLETLQEEFFKDLNRGLRDE
jgi:hypothetical protein